MYLQLRDLLNSNYAFSHILYAIDPVVNIKLQIFYPSSARNSSQLPKKTLFSQDRGLETGHFERREIDDPLIGVVEAFEHLL